MVPIPHTSSNKSTFDFLDRMVATFRQISVPARSMSYLPRTIPADWNT
jgi:hypothetical protein